MNTNTLKTSIHLSKYTKHTILKPNRKSHDFRELFVKTFSRSFSVYVDVVLKSLTCP